MPKYISTFNLSKDPEIEMTIPITAGNNNEARRTAKEYVNHYMNDDWKLVRVYLEDSSNHSRKISYHETIGELTSEDFDRLIEGK